ncbi:hypothetical protein Poli38472_007362 [Pythium oligandrum]|uniref:FYVE-type domain-containing protein n=1 Tax=Pythium oligandrum TaxID=41045 RepID=A0A8K1CB77_PYTOL|nr:hypothetical protein Poli38472_007362 [Pythium oligandrum]|eukprot:TMW59217.1 hypothetical protein Poli38472_007362 [Pythium oligandrum]
MGLVNLPAPMEIDGLTVYDRHTGAEKLLMSGQEISGDVLATLPKLQAAVQRHQQAGFTNGRKWKQRRRKNNVDLLELFPGGADDGYDDLDIAHALLATAELKCHVNEVLSVLIHRDSDEMDATVRSLGGRKVRDGRMLFQQQRRLSMMDADETAKTPPPTSLVGVEMLTIKPKFNVKLQTKQHLCLETCTIRYGKGERAYHLTKTLPKDAYDEIVAKEDRTALRRHLDHIAVGWDVRSLGSEGNGYGSSNHTTRVMAHSYASLVPSTQYEKSQHKRVSLNSSEMTVFRRAHMNSEAEHVMEVLTKSLREFESVIRRRRLGFQTFVSRQKEPDGYPACTICWKKFSLFRRDHFCRLCGHVVCSECSNNYDVEVRIGQVRKNRCCLACIRRVDSCNFDDEDIVPALGPYIVDSDDDAWLSTATTSYASSSEASLHSDDPREVSMALDALDQLVSLDDLMQSPHAPVSKARTKDSVRHHVHEHLSQSLRGVKGKYPAGELPVYAQERNYALEFDPDRTTHPHIPLAPIPDLAKEAKRLENIKTSGVLNPNYDRTALDLLAQVAAERMNCPVGIVSVVNETHFHPVGTYHLPPSEELPPRDENFCIHTMYAERPMILKNPQRDMRFSQMPMVRDGGIKFYAGFPVKAPDGSVVASLCTVDVVAHDHIATKEYATMQMLTQLAADLLLPPSKTQAARRY